MDLPDASPAPQRRRAIFSLPRLHRTSVEDWHQLIRFCVVGASGVLLNLAVFVVLFDRYAVHHLLAATISFAVAWTSNFLLNKHWTFRSHERSVVEQGARNLVVSLVALALNLLILGALTGGGVSEIVAQLVAIAVVTPVNFLLNRRWSFR